MSAEVAMRAADVGKCYVAYGSNWSRFAAWFGVRVTHKHEFWAARKISFSLRRGEALAIVGPNGAGKSTVLKLLTGTVRASTGVIQVAGRISAILELGLGFNPAFTGRENVYLAGGLMGFSTAELKNMMSGIEDLAELGEFFDQPIRMYSSGMQARLAFSVATATRPDILIVDEILSVGDSYFQHKSFARIREFKAQGTAIVFVTHNMGDVRALCDRAILLDKGEVRRDGAPDEVIDYYNAMVAERENATLTIEQRRKKDGWLTTTSGSKEVELKSLVLVDAASGDPLQMARLKQRLALCSVSVVNQPIKRLVMGHLLRDRTGHAVWGTNTWHTKQVLENLHPGQTVKYRFEFDCMLGPGSYGVTYNLVSTSTLDIDNFDSVDNFLVFDVANVDEPVFAGTTWLNPTITVELD